jgi:hypothetical protein
MLKVRVLLYKQECDTPPRTACAKTGKMQRNPHLHAVVQDDKKYALALSARRLRRIFCVNP